MTRQARQLRPATPGSAPSASPAPAARTPPEPPLWLCLGLPRLVLEARVAVPGAAEGKAEGKAETAAEGEVAALVIVDVTTGRVVQASRLAAGTGISPGLPLNAALALCPELRALARDETAERAALERLAAWAGAFTALVSLEPPAALLLEIRGSLRLFGGLEALRQRVSRALQATGYTGRQAVAPTPLAALWLARAGDTEAVTDPAALAGRIGRLSPLVTGWPERTLGLLRDLGVRTLADCLRLPRDGLARRIGREALADLDRALGRRPDPRRAFQPPERYSGMRELAAETTDTARLARALGALFAELEGFLRSRQRAVSQVDIRFSHLRRPATSLALGLAAPGLEAARFASVLAERLERLAMPAPVIAVGLEAAPGEALMPAGAGLFGDLDEGEAGPRLVERLRARLGRAAVHGMALRDEHRPERAWAVAEPGAASYAAGAPAGRRPAWLLEQPQQLACRDGQPCCEGPLVLESGPERLATGWWDGDEVARDYWIARTPAGARLWVFTAAPQASPAARQDWYLHGVFG